MSSTYPNNIVSENGDSFIPASQRPDGTWRKARRVKEGYVPQEEVPLYESKGKQFMSKKQEPVKLPTGQTAQRPIPGLFILEDKDKSKSKKQKKKIEEVTVKLDQVKITEKSKKQTEKVAQKEAVNNIEATDPAKKLKNLRKKLREIETLEEKLSKNEIAKPEPEQLAKIKRKGELVLQIMQLEKQIN